MVGVGDWIGLEARAIDMGIFFLGRWGGGCLEGMIDGGGLVGRIDRQIDRANGRSGSGDMSWVNRRG